MKIGCVYPQIELGGDPAALDRFGRVAEAGGFDHLVLYDHVLGASHEDRDPPLLGPYRNGEPFHDPLVAFGYLAGITQRIEFFTGVLILPQRQTVLVARQVADVDLLSKGRVSLGVGVGWNPVEFDALGQEFRKRGKRLDEQIPYLRRLWSGDLLEWTGTFDRIDRASLCPTPGRDIPIYCGGMTDAAFRRAARLADGFIFGGAPVPTLVGQWQQMKGLLAEEGRSSEGFGAHALIMSETTHAVPVETAADYVRRWQDAGGTHASIVSIGAGFRGVDEHLDFLSAVFHKAR